MDFSAHEDERLFARRTAAPAWTGEYACRESGGEWRRCTHWQILVDSRHHDPYSRALSRRPLRWQRARRERQVGSDDGLAVAPSGSRTNERGADVEARSQHAGRPLLGSILAGRHRGRIAGQEQVTSGNALNCRPALRYVADRGCASATTAGRLYQFLDTAGGFAAEQVLARGRATKAFGSTRPDRPVPLWLDLD